MKWVKADGDRPKDMAEGYRWLLTIARPGSNLSYQHPIEGVPVKQSQEDKDADAFLDSLIGEP